MPLDEDEGPHEPPAPRRRRRAVGPAGAAASRDTGLRVLAEHEEPAPDAGRDEQLRREVPPHHGS